MVKDAENIYCCTENQVRGLCVGGDMVILHLNERYNKMTTSPPTHNPLDFIGMPKFFTVPKITWMGCV